MKLTIRPSGKQDEPHIIQLQSELQEAEHIIDKTRNKGIEFAKKYLKYIKKELTKKHGHMFVAELNNQVIGLLTLFIEENEIEEHKGVHMYISDIVVGKLYRRQGIAQKLMTYAEKFAKDNNIKEIRLGVLANNISAFDLYKKKGYAPRIISLTKKLK